MVRAKTPPSRPERSLQPRQEAADHFLPASLPPPRNRRLRAHSPTFFLSKGEQLSPLIKQANQIHRLNQRVMGRLGLPYSAHLKISTITPAGVAVIHADSPGWINRGRFLQQTLLDLLHQEGARTVKEIKLRVRFSNEPPAPTPLPHKQPSKQIAEQLATQGTETEGALGASMRRLSKSLLRSRQR